MRLVERTLQQKALGGPVEIGIIVDESFDAEPFLNGCLRAMLLFEKDYSRFLPASRLSRLNAHGSAPLAEDDEFRTLLETAQQLAHQTRGIFNPFVLPALQRAGYLGSSDTDYRNDPKLDYRQRVSANIDDLMIGPREVRIPFGTAVDLGGCGKGYLADRIMERICQESSIVGAWVNLSGDIAAFGIDAEGSDISIATQRADTSLPHTVISVPRDGIGIATSGTMRRPDQTIIGHHIIDPRTGVPATTDIVLATVIAKTAVESDVFASCAVVAGSKEAPRLLLSLGVIGYLLQYRDGNHLKMITHGSVIALQENNYA